MKLWSGRFQQDIDRAADALNRSFPFDRRMFREDVEGSIAHVTMLGRCRIIDPGEAERIAAELVRIREDVEAGRLSMESDCEDVHTFVEEELTRRLGDAGRRLHTARSRNDQVATDIRLWTRTQICDIAEMTLTLCDALAELAGDNADAIMPGYTHLQRAQPVSFGHYMCAYAEMLLRDADRLQDCLRRLNISPLGSGALAGTTYETDRHLTAALLGFDAPCENSLDGVSDRDFALELMSALSILMMHISRLSEEMILWASLEFRFVELSDAYSTGSSIMPQKKNPDLCELARGKTGRVYGDLFTLLTVMKGLPLAYNKDMQEDKEALFDAVDTVRGVLCVFPDMLRTMRIRRENMRAAAGAGFINATDCADYLVKKGMPFRTAYKIVGEIVGECTQNGKTLESMSLADYKTHSELFGEDVYEAIRLENCLALRRSYGGPAPENVRAAVERLKGRIHVAAAAFDGEE